MVDPSLGEALSTTERVEREDIQGIVVRAYQRLPEARYLLAQIHSPVPARAWLGWLCHRITAAGPHAADRAVNVAFTASGLRKLGLAEHTLAMFADEFLEGMTEEHRSRALGDIGENAPERWEWGAPGDAPIDILLLLYATTETVLSDMLAEHSDALSKGGAGLVRTLETSHLEAREHFGFRDGISQPQLAGLGYEASPDAIRPGEVLLGYRNEYNRFTPRPLVSPADDPGDVLAADRENRGCRDLGLGGSYLVFRQLTQDVHAFWEFCERASMLAHGTVDEESRIRLAAELVGRWPSGAPLVLAPDHDQPHLQTTNDFAYFQADPDGLRCPVGAHIRRANPRDSLDPAPGTERSLIVNRLHRLLRRGRKYGPLLPLADVLSPGIDPSWRDQDRGLHFLCLGANLARQFEFIQQTWINNPRFAGLADSPDPLLGAAVDGRRTFSVPALPIRTRYRDLPRFVSVRGGAYFFLPGIRALRYLANLPARP
jgi:Dyp-type peroxidase family